MLEMLHKKLKSLVRIGKVALTNQGKTQSLQVETTKSETLDNVKLLNRTALRPFRRTVRKPSLSTSGQTAQIP